MSFSACKSSHILPLDTVAEMVADSYFVESEIHVKQWKYDTQNHALVKYDSLFAKYGITKEIYMQNIKYYFTNEKYATKIMDKVDEIVEQRVAALRDSLNITQ